MNPRVRAINWSGRRRRVSSVPATEVTIDSMTKAESAAVQKTRMRSTSMGRTSQPDLGQAEE
jgi:hypothetical protein